MQSITNLHHILSNKLKKKAIVILVIILITTILEVLGIGLVIPFFIIIFEGNDFSENGILHTLLKNFSKDELITYGALSILFIFFFKNLTLSIFSVLESKFIWKVKKYLSEQILQTYLIDEKNFVDKDNSSFILNLLVREISFFVHLLINCLVFISESLIFFSISLIMLFLKPKIFLFLLFFIFLFFLIVVFLSKKKVNNLSLERFFFDKEYHKNSTQLVDGIREIKIYDQSSFFLNKFFNINDNIFRVNWKLEQFQKVPKFWLEYFIVLFIFGLILYLNSQNFESQNIAVILSFIAIVGSRLYPSANKLYQSFQKVKFYYPSFTAISDAMQKYNNIKSNNKKALIQKTDKKLFFKDEIKISNLSFSYGNKEILKDVNFSIKKNKLIGIYGTNGSGKSTLLDLIFGFAKPKSGSIFVDNTNIDNSLNEWQNKISYIPQNIYLVDTSILENIIFKEEIQSSEKINLDNALDRSNLKDVLKNFPNGLRTLVGERGSKISGGQQQRIGLARALFRQPEILVMDESFNAIDQLTSNQIINSVKNMTNITRIIVSHNIEILEQCDETYKLSNGTIQKIDL